jgi:hypothetical protein
MGIRIYPSAGCTAGRTNPSPGADAPSGKGDDAHFLQIEALQQSSVTLNRNCFSFKFFNDQKDGRWHDSCRERERWPDVYYKVRTHT